MSLKPQEAFQGNPLNQQVTEQAGALVAMLANAVKEVELANQARTQAQGGFESGPSAFGV